MRLAGYLVHTPGGDLGSPGFGYTYFLASNGLFVHARGSLLAATIRIAEAPVRGLLPLEEKVELTRGRVPRCLYELALGTLSSDPWRERYLAITYEGEYRLRMPPQEGEAGGVRYEVLPNTILDIHSHGSLRAFFSGTDDRDEQGLRLYMVVGRLDTLLYMVVGRLDTLLPEVEMRVGVYGYFALVGIEEVFG